MMDQSVMASNFSNSFTGKGIYQPLPSGEGLQRSGERMSDLILQADRLKLDTFKRNEEEFLKSSNVDPIFIVSQAARETQQKMLDKFNTDWGKKFQQYGGNLPTEEKVRMAKEKDFLMMQQAKMKGDMERAMQEREMLSRDIRGELDHEQGTKKWEDYIKTGSYDETPLMPSELDPELFFNTLQNKLRGTESKITEQVKTPQGTVETQIRTASGSENEAKEYVKAHLASNDRFARGVIKQFSDLKTADPKKYQEYLNSSDNPILQFAQDKYWKKALILGEAQSEKPATVPRAATTTPIKIGGVSFRYEPSESQQATFANRDYNTYHPVLQSPVLNIPTKDVTILDEYGENLSSVKTISVKLTGYDEEKDEFTFIAESNYDGTRGRGNQIAIKRTQAPKELWDMEVISGGKKVKIKDLKGGVAPATEVKKKAY
jgi:hypothetical protein